MVPQAHLYQILLALDCAHFLTATLASVLGHVVLAPQTQYGQAHLPCVANAFAIMEKTLSAVVRDTSKHEDACMTPEMQAQFDKAFATHRPGNA